MDADRTAPVCETGEVLVPTGPDIVWDTLTDLRSWPRWMPGVKRVDVGEPFRVGTTFRWKAGPGTIRSRILESDRPRRVAWKGRTLGIDAVHVWRIEAYGDGSRVVTEESWSGLLARLLRGTMAKAVRKALDEGLPALRDEAERRARPTS